MTTPTLEEKQCPSCGQPVPHSASLCRHCGYDYLSPTVLVPATHTPSQSSLGTATLWVFPPWVIFGIATIVVLLVVVIATNFRRPNDPLASWQSACALSHARSSHDGDFEQMFKRRNYLAGVDAEVAAYDGLLLIHLPNSWPSGLSGRYAGQSVARIFASVYSNFRQLAGESTHVTCIVYVRGRRFSQGEWPPPASR